MFFKYKKMIKNDADYNKYPHNLGMALREYEKGFQLTFNEEPVLSKSPKLAVQYILRIPDENKGDPMKAAFWFRDRINEGSVPQRSHLPSMQGVLKVFDALAKDFGMCGDDLRKTLNSSCWREDLQKVLGNKIAKEKAVDDEWDFKKT